MTLTEEEIKSIEDYASWMFTPSEIAIVMQKSEVDILNELKNSDSDFYKAFYKGLLITQAQIRKTQLSFAVKGNQTCIDRFETLINKLNTILP